MILEGVLDPLLDHIFVVLLLVFNVHCLLLSYS